MPPSIDQLVTFLYTDDLVKTSRFYEEIIGLSLILDQGSCRIYQVGGDAFVGFCQNGTAVGARQNREKQEGVILTLVSNQVDEWYSYLQTQNIPIEKPPTYYPAFDIYHLFIRDPNGYLLEVQTFQDPSWPTK